jgi:hypothetical protein
MKAHRLLVDWFPEAWVQLLDPGAQVGAVTTREALAFAVITVVFVVLFRVARGVLRGVGRMLGSGRGHAELGGFSVFVRRMAGLAVVGLPIARVVHIATEGADLAAAPGFTMMAGALWGVLAASDHRAAYVEGEQPVLVLREGFAVFKVRERRIPLADALVVSATGLPIGRIGGWAGRVRLRKEARAAIEEVLGRSGPMRWLRPLLAAEGLVLESRRGEAAAG